MPKGYRERRYLSIVHPRSQALLNDLLSRQWSTIERWVSRSVFTFDRVSIVAGERRATAEPQFILHNAHKESIASVAKWILQTDITRFYPTIYTHSIAWAAHGKETYKRNPKRFNGGLADQLDVAVRKCNRDQTIGIPIGPDSSWIVAEIISSYVDTNVQAATGLSTSEADRMQDDWVVGNSSLEEAEKRLSAIVRAYQKLGLDINGRKTAISHIRDVDHPTWRARILPLSQGSRMQGERLAEFLRYALALQSEYPSEPVLAYAFAVLEGVKFRGRDIPQLESFIARAVAVDPRVIDRACILYINLHHEGFKLDLARLKRRFVPLVEDALEAGEAFEAIWTLHLFRGLRISLDGTRVAELSAASDNPSVCLVLLDMEAEGLVTSLPRRQWLRRISASKLDDPIWLLAYEGVRHKWLPDPGKKLQRSAFLKPMFQRNVVFYDPRKNVPNRVSRRRRRLAQRRSQWNVVLTQLFGYGAP